MAARRPPRRTAVPTTTDAPAGGPVVGNNRATRWLHTLLYLVTFVLLATGWWLRTGHEEQPTLLADVLDTPDTELHRMAGWVLLGRAVGGPILGIRGTLTFLRDPARQPGRWCVVLALARGPDRSVRAPPRPLRSRPAAAQRRTGRSARHRDRQRRVPHHAFRRADVRHHGAGPPGLDLRADRTRRRAPVGHARDPSRLPRGVAGDALAWPGCRGDGSPPVAGYRSGVERRAVGPTRPRTTRPRRVCRRVRAEAARGDP